jgi:hypothetical protein
MYWILAAPTLAALLILATLIPYRVVRGAFEAARTRDRRRNGPAVRAERRALGRFMKRAALVPLALLLVIQAGLIIHHEFLGPAHLLANVYGAYHPEVALSAPDLEAWSLAYEARERARASSSTTVLRSIRVAMAEHWPLYPGYLFLSSLFLLYFYGARYPRLVVRYRRSVRSRNQMLRSQLPDGVGWQPASRSPTGLARHSP